MLNCEHDGLYWCSCSKEIEGKVVMRKDGKIVGIKDIAELDKERERILCKSKISDKDMNRLKEIKEYLKLTRWRNLIFDSDIKAESIIHRAAEQLEKK